MTMNLTEEDKQIIFEREKKLMMPEYFNAFEEIRDLLDDEFVEVGQSGKIYNKVEVLEILNNRSNTKYIISDIKFSVLSGNLVLLNYKAYKYRDTIAVNTPSVRSSIWQKTNGCWRLRFHQGTAILP
jgi:hypothetical protein